MVIGELCISFETNEMAEQRGLELGASVHGSITCQYCAWNDDKRYN